MATILIAEDEKRIQDIIVDYLSKDGYDCLRADDGVDALTILKSNPVDMLILDIMMPHLDGFSVCEIARELSSLPIIILTAKQDESDKLKGYELGADDYITKPFSPNILAAKVRALLKRAAPFENQSIIHAGRIRINSMSHEVYADNCLLELTHKEYELLLFFVRNQKQVFSREQLLNRIWGYDFEGTTRTVDVHIKNLRQKLAGERNYIVTLIRSGYKFMVVEHE